MSNLLEFPDLEATREQAADWVARLDRGLSTAEQAALRQWCASPANARLLREMSGLWTDMDVMRQLAEVLPQPVAAPAPPAARGRRTAIAACLAAGLALLGIGGYRHFAALQSAPNQPQVVTYTTAVGEHRDETLADGSLLTINTDSAVQVLSLQGAARELQLLRGEAHFTVAHDPAHPFRVRAGSEVIEDVGTAFNVRLHQDGSVEVLVTDGRVRLIPANPAADHLDRGQMLRIDADGKAQLATFDDAALAQQLAWRNGMIVFDGQSLAAALREFSRYTPARFAIDDPQLQALRIGGYFPVGNTDFLLDALHSNFGLEATRAADGTIRIARGH